jgi:predicted CopG family antitoxin
MSITIEVDLYETLKRTAGPRGMSRFISDVLREALTSSEQQLARAYQAAGRDSERQAVLRDWDAIETKGW